MLLRALGLLEEKAVKGLLLGLFLSGGMPKALPLLTRVNEDGGYRKPPYEEEVGGYDHINPTKKLLAPLGAQNLQVLLSGWMAGQAARRGG